MARNNRDNGARAESRIIELYLSKMLFPRASLSSIKRKPTNYGRPITASTRQSAALLDGHPVSRCACRKCNVPSRQSVHSRVHDAPHVFTFRLCPCKHTRAHTHVHGKRYPCAREKSEREKRATTDTDGTPSHTHTHTHAHIGAGARMKIVSRANRVQRRFFMAPAFPTLN